MKERFTHPGSYLYKLFCAVNTQYIFTFLFILSINVAFAQPANDDCNSAINVPTDGSCQTFNNTDATSDIANGDCTNGSFNVWFSFVAQGSNYTIDATSPVGSFRPEITLLQFDPTPCDFASAIQFNCAEDQISGTLLTPGQTYYIIVTSGSDQFADFDLCVDNPIDAAPPANDDPCAATVVTPNGSCNPGTTVDATGDFFNPACGAGFSENTVWYSTTLTAGNNSLNINLQNSGLTGTISVNLITFPVDCNGGANIVAGGTYCGDANGANFDVGSLTPGTTYYVQVGSSTAGEGDFNICLTESGPPPGCSLNDICNDADLISGITSGNPPTCATGCNIGATSEPGLIGCNMATEEVVWYTFTSDNIAGLMSLSVTSNDIAAPTVQVFTGNCNGLAQITDCVTGSNGLVQIVNESISPNTTYYVAVSNSFGSGGNFELCISTFEDISACATESELYVQPGSPSFGSPDNGPYQPGETVTYCFDLINYHADPIGSGNNCQWLQGIVPVFGECWDMSTFDPTASIPPTLYAGVWDWYATGINYNFFNPNITIGDFDGDGDIDMCHITEPGCSNVGTNAGQILPPGWFNASTFNTTNPNTAYGDGAGCNVDMGPWNICFNITTKSFAQCGGDPQATDCTVKIYTFADGETGNWNGGSSICAQDIPQITSNSLNCCAGPIMNPTPVPDVCSGEQTSIVLTSDQDPNVTYTWEVLPTAVIGASACQSNCGNFITQILTNTSPVPQTVTYVVTPTATDGCIGLPVNIMVTVLPEIDITIPPLPPVCSGSCVNLNTIVTGGQPPYSYMWDNGSIDSSPEVCPTLSTTYTVTVTDANQCTGTESVTVQANSNLVVELEADPGTQICQNDPNFPITLTASVAMGGSGNYSYNWSPVAGASSTQPVFNIGTDLYCVTVTDLLTQCTGTECIQVTVDLPPFVSVVPFQPQPECVDNYQLLGVPSGGTWGGVADPFGVVYPSILGEGVYSVSYTYQDILTGCVDSTVVDLTVVGSPDVDSLGDFSACNEFILPTITGTNLTGNQSYYSGPGATGIPSNEGDAITTSTTLYIYDGDSNCFDEEIINITITPLPEVDDIADQTVCNFYVLPDITGTNLTGNEAFYDASGGMGTLYNSGDTIFSNTTLFIYDDDGSGTCGAEESFIITVNSQPVLDPIDDVEACNFYTLPAITGTDLTGNEAYYTGTGGTGTSYAAGDMINASTTLFAYDGTASCNDEVQFEITIFLQPDLDEVLDQTACNTYTLPAITGNNLSGNESYFSGPNGTGTLFSVGDVISSNTTIYIYDNAGIAACEDEESFTITIFLTPEIDDIDNVTACDQYILPVITGSNLSGNEGYFSGPGGSGTTYNPGDIITSNTTIFYYDNVGIAGCESEGSFSITITPTPELDQPNNIEACNEYILPAISGNNLNGTEAYFTGASGTGTSYNAGEVINSSTTLFIYINVGTANCEDEVSFDIEITPAPVLDDIQDQVACNTYILPDITGTNLSGNQAYYSGSNGTGMTFNPGDEINSSTTIFIYDDAGISNCNSEQSFDIEITQQPDIIEPAPVSACDSYTLLPITGSNLTANAAYYSGTDGTGTSYLPGDVITTTTTLFIYDENGGAACSDQEQFLITINSTPTSDFTVTGPICTDEFSTITFTGNAGTNATFNWNFGGGTILSGTDAGPYEIQWSGAGNYNISLTVEENNCTSTLSTETVTVEAPLAAPVINCNPSTTSIEFTWNAIAGASGYNVVVNTGQTGTMTGATSFEVTGLTPNTTVEITVEAIGTAPCGSSFATFECDAVNCPDIIVDIDAVDDICFDGNNSTIQLNAVVMNSDGSGIGTWSGPGVDPSTGIFDPNDAAVSIGANNITYTFEEVSCTFVEGISINVFQQPTALFDVNAPLCVGDTAIVSYAGNASTSATYNWDFGTATVISGTGQGPFEVTWPAGMNETISLTVIENACTSETEIVNISLDQPLAAPVINCMSNTSEITFTWDDIPGANSYDVILVNGVSGVQNGNSYEVVGLNPNDSVTITVIAIGSGACGNSSATVTCYANNCPNIVIDISAENNNICLDGSEEIQSLTAIINGGDGNGTGTWNGPGITDQTLGIFDPNDPSAMIGSNTITYFYSEQGCNFTQAIDIVLFSPPSSTFDVQSPICSDQTCMINYTGNALNTATYEWDFAGGSVVSGSGSGPYEISFSTGGVYDVSLLITDENGCVSQQLFQSVEVLQELQAPVINCMTTTSSIEFSWNDVAGASSYEVNVLSGATGVLNGNTYLVDNLNPDDEVEIELTAIGLAPCGNTTNTALCTATACNTIILLIEPVDDICLDANTAPICLEVETIGDDGSGDGIWTGPGMPANGGCLFDPTDANPGENVITYTYMENGCTYIETTSIFVYFASTASFTATSPICENGISIIEAVTVSGATYDWDFDTGTVISGSGPGPYEISWPDEGDYVVTLLVTNANDCVSNMVNQTVSVIAPLDPPVINCMTSTSEIEFSWSDVDGATGYQVNVLQGETGILVGNTYTITGLNPNDSVTIELVILGDAPCGDTTVTQTCYATDCANIVLTIDPVADFCLTAANAPFNLIATVDNSDGTGTGEWSGNGIIDINTGLFDPNDPSVSFGPNIITYTFTENGCPFSEDVIINVNQTPEVMITNGGEISCASPQAILNATVNGSNLVIQWTGGNITSGDSDLMITVDQSAWYYITATDSITGCSNVDSILVTEGADLPTAFAGSDITLNCALSAGFLNAGDIASDQIYQWEGPLATDQINEQNPEVTESGTYILTVLDTLAACASTPDTVIVILDNTPPPAIILPSPLDTIDCELLVLSLNAQEVLNATYEWVDQNGQPQGDGPSITVETEGLYYLTVLDTLNGCFDLDSVTVIDNTDYPLINLAPPGDLNCANVEVELNANGSQTGTSIVIDWSGPLGGISGPLDELSTTAIAPGVYTLSLVDTLNGCQNDTTFIINQINDAPIAATNIPDELDCGTDNVEISGLNSSGTGTLTYEWIYNNSTIAQEVNTTATETGVYTLIVTDGTNDCSDTTFVSVFESANLLDGALISTDDPSCYGENDGVVYIDTVFGGTPNYQYALEGNIFSSVTVMPGLTAGEYTLTVMDQEECTWDTTFTIFDPAPIELNFNSNISAQLGDDLLLQLGDDANVSIQYNIPEAQVDTIIWTPMEMLVCLDSLSENCHEVYAAPLDNLLIGATLIDTTGCSISDEILLRVDKERLIFVPNVFTPNGDNENDVLMIFGGQGVKQINKFLVYDRWGETMYEGFNFQPNDPAYGWDGTLRGEALNPAVFVYWAEVELIDGQKVLYKGDITLIR